MAQALASHLIARTLKQRGVETLFYLMGGPNVEIINGCQDEGLRTIDVRHEQAAAIVATSTPWCCTAMAHWACP